MPGPPSSRDRRSTPSATRPVRTLVFRSCCMRSTLTFRTRVRDLASPFLMPIESVHTIEGRGTVVTGRVGRGVLPVGARVEIIGLEDEESRPRQVTVTGIQVFHRDQAEARAGENCGLLLRNVKRDEVVRGQVLIAPGSVRPHGRVRAELFLLTAKEGGRHTPALPGLQAAVLLRHDRRDRNHRRPGSVGLRCARAAHRGRNRVAQTRRDRSRDAVRSPRGQQDRGRWGGPRGGVAPGHFRPQPRSLPASFASRLASNPRANPAIHPASKTLALSSRRMVRVYRAGAPASAPSALRESQRC